MEQRADHTQSKQQGQLLNLEELPQFLRASTKDLENTAYYKQNGYVWFYLDTVGTIMNGLHKFNPEGQTVQEMFKPVSEREYDKLPFNERARFWAGKQPLRVGLNRVRGAGRLGVYGRGSPQLVAPVVVVKPK